MWEHWLVGLRLICICRLPSHLQIPRSVLNLIHVWSDERKKGQRKQNVIHQQEGLWCEHCENFAKRRKRCRKKKKKK